MQVLIAYVIQLNLVPSFSGSHYLINNSTLWLELCFDKSPTILQVCLEAPAKVLRDGTSTIVLELPRPWPPGESLRSRQGVHLSAEAALETCPHLRNVQSYREQL